IVVGGHSPSDPMKTPSSNQRFFQSISFGDCAGTGWTKTVQPKQKDPTISKTRGAAYKNGPRRRRRGESEGRSRRAEEAQGRRRILAGHRLYTSTRVRKPRAEPPTRASPVASQKITNWLYAAATCGPAMPKSKDELEAPALGAFETEPFTMRMEPTRPPPRRDAVSVEDASLAEATGRHVQIAQFWSPWWNNTASLIADLKANLKALQDTRTHPAKTHANDHVMEADARVNITNHEERTASLIADLKANNARIDALLANMHVNLKTDAQWFEMLNHGEEAMAEEVALDQMIKVRCVDEPGEDALSVTDEEAPAAAVILAQVEAHAEAQVGAQVEARDDRDSGEDGQPDNLLKLFFLLGPFRAGLSSLSPRRLVYLNKRILGNGHAWNRRTARWRVRARASSC
ncbi:hypothetical protein THAOC_25663, partial [Thalassiosira oceanica]